MNASTHNRMLDNDISAFTPFDLNAAEHNPYTVLGLDPDSTITSNFKQTVQHAASTLHARLQPKPTDSPTAQRAARWRQEIVRDAARSFGCQIIKSMMEPLDFNHDRGIDVLTEFRGPAEELHALAKELQAYGIRTTTDTLPGLARVRVNTADLYMLPKELLTDAMSHTMDLVEKHIQNWLTHCEFRAIPTVEKGIGIAFFGTKQDTNNLAQALRMRGFETAVIAPAKGHEAGIRVLSAYVQRVLPFLSPEMRDTWREESDYDLLNPLKWEKSTAGPACMELHGLSSQKHTLIVEALERHQVHPRIVGPEGQQWLSVDKQETMQHLASLARA